MRNKDIQLINTIRQFIETDTQAVKNDLTQLIQEYERKSKRLDVIIKQSDKQQFRLLELNEELDVYKNKLEEKVETEIQKRKNQESLLEQQSRLAAMGEMIDAIAHQWLQPINIINMQIGLLHYDFDDGLIDKAYITHFQSESNKQIQHITDTLNEFRSFFRPVKELATFNIKQSIESVISLIHDELMLHSINTSINIKHDIQLFAIENEFKHIILNILNNAKDAYIENPSRHKSIIITLSQSKTHNIIEISDQAGGIPENIIANIFKANITSKEKGTGIGLYMSTQITEKFHGSLSVKNTANGAIFTLAFPLE